MTNTTCSAFYNFASISLLFITDYYISKIAAVSSVVVCM